MGDPEHMKESIRNHLTYIKTNLPNMKWFDRQIKNDWQQQISRSRAEALAYRNKDHRADEIKELEDRLKGDAVAKLDVLIGKIREQLSHNRYTMYQLERIFIVFESGFTKLSTWCEYLLKPSPQGLVEIQAPNVIWNALNFCLIVDKEPPPVIHRNFRLSNRHPDKTDQYGKRFYAPLDNDGMAIPDFDLSQLSQTDAAKNMRKVHGAYMQGQQPISTGIKTQAEVKTAMDFKNKQRAEAKQRRQALDEEDKHRHKEALEQRKKELEERKKKDETRPRGHLRITSDKARLPEYEDITEDKIFVYDPK